MENYRGKITAHFMAHWGVPTEIRPYEIGSLRASLAILQFAPRGARQTWRYATNGMSSYLQHSPDFEARVRTELFACTLKKEDWIDDLLKAIASYPADYSTYLSQGDTIEVGQPIDRRKSCFTGILISPPGPIDPSSLGVIDGLENDVLVHQVVGLTPAEICYTQKYGGAKLWESIAQNGDPILDQSRSK